MIVKAPHWEDTCLNFLEKLGNGSTASGIMRRREDTFGLVQDNGNLGFQSGDEAVVNAYGVFPPDHLRTRLADNLALNRSVRIMSDFSSRNDQRRTRRSGIFKFRGSLVFGSRIQVRLSRRLYRRRWLESPYQPVNPED